jgi:CheY-like chemotaxis protein
MVPKSAQVLRCAKGPLIAKIEGPPDVFAAVTDEEGQTLWVNAAFEAITGYAFEEIKGRKAQHVLLPADSGSGVNAAIAGALRAHEPLQTEIPLARKLRPPITASLEILPLFDENACQAGFLFAGRKLEWRQTCPGSWTRLSAPLKAERVSANGSGSRAAAARKAYRILVAEDHPINLKLVVALLEAARCEVWPVTNGRQALQEFESCEFDLVIMDSQMPIMTGIEAIAAIRRRSDWKRFTPILSLTAHAMKGAEEFHTLAGADLYISKPLRSDCFIGAVNQLAERGRSLRTEYGKISGAPAPLGGRH